MADAGFRRQRLQEWRKQEFPDFDPWHFNDTVMNEVHADSRVLEIGAGSGIGMQTQMPLKGNVAFYAGVDIDPRVVDNPMLDEAHVADAVQLPFEDNSFDLVFHTMVAEHLADPDAAVQEALRVLKPGGLLLFHTVSFWYYASVVAAMTPHWFHTFFVKHLGMGRIEEDVFPTYYRINTARAYKRVARRCNVEVEVENLSVPPAYLAFHPLTWRLGVWYLKTMERWLPWLRGQIVCRITKPGAPSLSMLESSPAKLTSDAA